MPRLAAVRRFLAFALVSVVLPSWAQGLPVVLGERVTGVPAKPVASPYFLTIEEEMPARALRLRQPTARELSSLGPGKTSLKRVAVGIGRGVADAAEVPAAR